jgi:long-chain acyl-CoA synthetase
VADHAGVDRPWLRFYDDGLPEQLDLEHPTGLAMFRATVARHPAAAAVHYLDSTLTVTELDRLSDALACALLEGGVGRGDRVALYLQNVPAFLVGVLAAWKVGAAMVPINPMNRARELDVLCVDSKPSALICLDSLYEEVVRDVASAPELVITTSPLDFVREPDAHSLLAGVGRRRPVGTLDLVDLATRYAGRRPPEPTLGPDDPAFLTYTSGTTGPPKGAVNTHANVVHNAQANRDWMHIGLDDVVLGIAPLFHITGLMGHVALALMVPAPLVLGYRFDPATMLDLIERYRPTFAIGAITAFLALMNDPSIGDRDVSSLQKVFSGGQAIPPATIESFRAKLGIRIRAAYGLTETTAPSHMVPASDDNRVDPQSGALSVGVPIFGTDAWIVDEDGRPVSAGTVGEIVIAGPQVVPGYWEKPEETANAFPGGALHTGDVGFMDADGWFYIVDRKKDQINAAGYKIWPREVEDVLYEHPAVREAAVVGVPDEYRGETVKAFVSLVAGVEATPDELIAFCKERMAAYKYPRAVDIIDEIPKTVSGKILRRELRDGPSR